MASRRLHRLLRRASTARFFHSDERGAVALLSALLLIGLMGMLALTLDVGYAFGRRRMAQNVADSGALAGAYVIGEKLIGVNRTDADVLAAIRDTGRNSSGAFSSSTTDYFTAVYVGHSYDANGNGVPYDLSPSAQVGSAPGGTIPSGATGVRLTPRKANATFFAPALGTRTMSASAQATALALDIVGFGAWAPYAIWAGETQHRCYNSSYDPTSGLRTANDPVAGTMDYVYGCVPLYGGTQNTPAGGPNGPLSTGPGGINPNCWVPLGQSPPNGCKPTQVIYYSSSYQNRNVKNGDQADSPYGVTRWSLGNNNFKGFFHTNNMYLDIGSTTTFDTNGGYAQGPSDLDTLATCRNQNTVAEPNNCLMILPVVRYATGGGTANLTVAGFLPVRLLTDPYGNSNDLAAEITMAVLSERDVKTGPCPTNGPPCLKVARLVR